MRALVFLLVPVAVITYLFLFIFVVIIVYFAHTSAAGTD
jgi:hypothetical protein